MSNPIVLDSDGGELRVGSRVSVGPAPDDHGTVVSISDIDGDVDSYGRPFSIGPRVYVKFDDGLEDDFGTSSTARWYTETDAPYLCDDLLPEVTHA